MILNNINDFYVYVYLDPRKFGEFSYGEYKFNYEPFYIGKGRDRRDKRHLNESNYKCGKTHKYKLINLLIQSGYSIKPIRIKENLSEVDAFNLEIKLIKNIGRKDKELGPLCNHTDGGDGASGMINITKGKTLESVFGYDKANEIKKKYSEARKKYLINNSIIKKDKIKKPRISKKGKTLIEIHGIDNAKIIREKIIKTLVPRKKGEKISEETKKKISLKLIGNTNTLGHVLSEETKKKISQSKKGTLSWNASPVIQLTSEGDFIKEWVSATNAAKILKLSQGNIWSVINNKRKLCGGYKWKIGK